MEKMILDFDGYIRTARQAVAEGQVLLLNENQALPLKKIRRWHCLEESSCTITKAEPVRVVWSM